MAATADMIRRRIEASAPESIEQFAQQLETPDPAMVDLFRELALLANLRGQLATREEVDAETRRRGDAAIEGRPLSASPRWSLPAVAGVSASAAQRFDADTRMVACAEGLLEKLPFTQAIDRLRRSLALSRPEFDELDATARTQAFTMARTLDQHVLDAVRDELAATQDTSENFRTFWERMQRVAKDNDWIGTTEHHASQVYHESLGKTYTLGRAEAGQKLGLRAIMILPTTSAQERPEHEPFVGNIYKYIPGQTPLTPWDYGCNHSWRWVDEYELQDLGADWDALPMLEIPPSDTGYTPVMARQRGDAAMGTDGTIAVVCDQVNVAAVPGEVVLIPWGEVKSSSGDMVVDEVAANLILEELRTQGVDIPIDYEHQTLGGEYSAPDGKAPAAGWVKRIVAQVGRGIVGVVEWTERARQMLAAKEYRYLSPVALVRRSDRRVLAIKSAALTNAPAIAGMPAIVNKNDQRKDAEAQRAPFAPSRLCVPTVSDSAAPRGGAQTFVLTMRRLAMKQAKEKARQTVNSSALSPDAKVELLALVDALPDDAGVQANKDLLKPLGELAAKLGDEGKALGAAIEKANLELAASSIEALVNRASLATGEMAKQSERILSLEKAIADRDWESFVAANSAKLPPATRDDWKTAWSKDRAGVERIVASMAPLVTNAAATAGSASAAAGVGTRKAAILAAKDAILKDLDGTEPPQGGVRAAVNGILIANRQAALSDAEAVECQLTV